MLAGEGAPALSRELTIRRKLLYQWRDQYRRGGSDLLRSPGRPPHGSSSPTALTPRPAVPSAPQESQLAELERKVGRQQLVIDFLQGALAQSRGRNREDELVWRQRLYPYLREVATVQGTLSINEMCNWLDVSCTR